MRWMRAPLLALVLLAAPARALAQVQNSILPIAFVPVSLAMYDDQTEFAFFPSKGIQEYTNFDEPPMGYVQPPDPGQAGRNTQYFLQTDGEENTHRIFALIRIKAVNYFPHQEELDGSDFYLQGKLGDIYPPHPFTVATTHVLMEPHGVSFIDLGFDVPGGRYSLYYKTQLPDGKRVADEIWRYNITIDRGPVNAMFRLLPELVTRYVDAIFTFLGGVLGLND